MPFSSLHYSVREPEVTVCFSVTPKLSVTCYASETQTWDSLIKAGIALPYVKALVMLLPCRNKELSLHPFAKRSSAELHVCAFCSGSQ